MNLQSGIVSSNPIPDWKAKVMTIQDLEAEIQKIKERNKRVEIVPALAFILSTASLPFFKNLWLKYIYKK